MPYTVYKVTNRLTQDFYIGVHKTDDPNDAYLGSGKIIKVQVAAYGANHFIKEILFNFENRRDAYDMEIRLIEPVLGTPGCLNIHPGGKGGFAYLGKEALKAVRAAAQQRITELRNTNPEFAEAFRQQRLQNIKQMQQSGILTKSIVHATAAWTGCHHTDASRKRMSEAKTGTTTNSCWITNSDGASQRINKTELEKWIALGWKLGRKCNMSEQGRANIGVTGRRTIAHAQKCKLEKK